MKNKTNVWRKKEKTLTHAGVFKTIIAKEIFLIAVMGFIYFII